MPRWAESGTPGWCGIRRTSSGRTTAWVRQPCRWKTISPSRRSGVRRLSPGPACGPPAGRPARSRRPSVHGGTGPPTSTGSRPGRCRAPVRGPGTRCEAEVGGGREAGGTGGLVHGERGLGHGDGTVRRNPRRGQRGWAHGMGWSMKPAHSSRWETPSERNRSCPAGASHPRRRGRGGWFLQRPARLGAHPPSPHAVRGIERTGRRAVRARPVLAPGPRPPGSGPPPTRAACCACWRRWPPTSGARTLGGGRRPAAGRRAFRSAAPPPAAARPGPAGRPAPRRRGDRHRRTRTGPGHRGRGRRRPGRPRQCHPRQPGGAAPPGLVGGVLLEEPYSLVHPVGHPEPRSLPLVDWTENCGSLHP